MPTAESDPTDPKQDPWLHTVYEVSNSDTRWAKEQAWRVINWSFLLLAALIPIAKILVSHVPLWSFTVVGLALVSFSWLELVRLYRFADQARARCNDIQTRVRIDPLLVGTPTKQSVHRSYLIVQCAAVLLALGAVLLVMRYLPPNVCGVAA